MAGKRIMDEIIIEIYKDNLPIKELAKKYNVSPITVKRIKNLEYNRYKKVIENYLKTQNKSIKEVKKVKDTKEVKSETKNDQLGYLDLSFDQFTGIIFSVLTNYVQPVIAKFLIDNYVLSKETKTLMETLLQKINESKSESFFKNTLAIVVSGLMSKCLQEKYFEKIFKEDKNEDEK